MKLKLNLLSLFFCLTFLFVSCEKEDQILGLGMLPDTDILTTLCDSTSVSISFSTVNDDSVRSSLITYMVGENYDDVFGASRAGYVTRLYLQGMVGDLDEFKMDSVCFRLSKSSKYFYGDTTVPQSFSVYELNHDITVGDCAGYNQFGAMPTCINSKNEIITFDFPAYKDTVSSFSKKFDSEYAKNLYDKVLSCYDKDTIIQRFDSLFIKQFKGIYVTTKNDVFNGTHSVITHCVPEMTFYLSGKDTTVQLVFSPSPQAYNDKMKSDPSQIYMQAINVFEHEYPTEISSNLNTYGDKSYVQGMLGLKTRLNLSGLETWRDSVMVVNYAKLVLPLEKRDSWSEYLPLNLRIYDSQRNMVYSTMSATKDSSIFEFNVHTFLVDLFNNPAKADTYSYEVTVPENNTYANSFVLDGMQTEKLKLIITYTK